MKLQTAIDIATTLENETFHGLICERVHFTRARYNYGHVDHNGIALNPRNISGIAELTETLYHELVHIFVDDVLETPDDGEHGTIYWTWYFRLLPNYIKAHYYGD